MTYTYQVRSFAAPLGDGEHEVLCEGNFTACADYASDYKGTTWCLEHAIVAIDDSGNAVNIDYLPDDEIQRIALL